MGAKSLNKNDSLKGFEFFVKDSLKSDPLDKKSYKIRKQKVLRNVNERIKKETRENFTFLSIIPKYILPSIIIVLGIFTSTILFMDYNSNREKQRDIQEINATIQEIDETLRELEESEEGLSNIDSELATVGK